VPNSGSGIDGTLVTSTTGADTTNPYCGLSPLNKTLWSAGGIVFDAVNYLDLLPYISYNDDVWIKWVKAGAQCIVKDIVTTDILDSGEHADMETWKGGGTCGGGVAPFL